MDPLLERYASVGRSLEALLPGMRHRLGDRDGLLALRGELLDRHPREGDLIDAIVEVHSRGFALELRELRFDDGGKSGLRIGRSGSARPPRNPPP